MKRTYLATVLVLFVLGLVLGACATPTPVAPAETGGESETGGEAQPAETQAPAEEVAPTSEELGPVTLQFTGWTYDLEKVQENLAVFEEWVATEADPPVKATVEMSDAGFGEFDTHVTTAYAAGNSFDVLYGSDHWLAKWAEAGWVLPLEDYFPGLKEKYVGDIAPFSVEAMTYDGKLYGLPYYTDVMYFFYNKDMLAEAGIENPPTTWDEVREQALAIKEAGVSDSPVMVALAASSWFDETFFALAYSNGAKFFDENFQPVFETTQGPVYDTIEWLAAALNDDQIMPQSVMEMTAVDVQEAFKNGDSAFVIVPGYMVLEFNTPDISKIAGSAEVAMMPGITHETDGYTRMYLLGKGAPEDEATLQASLHLIEFLGGKTNLNGEVGYHIAKRWAVDNGLGFSINSLWQDPDVNATFAKMGNTTIMQQQKEIARSKEGMAAPWFAEWISFVRTEVQKAVLRQASTDTVLQNLQDQWNALASE